jgi:RNA methyltransferase, TrmH family
VKQIASAENAQFKSLLKLAHSSRARREQGCSLLDGIHLVAAYQHHVGSPEQIVVSRSGLDNPEIQNLLKALAPREPMVLSDALFKQLSTVETPTGVLAAVATPRPRAAPANIDACVMLEDIQDPGNLGSILRSAAAAGVRHVFLSVHCVHAWSPRVLRAGMGAHFMTEIHEQCDLLALAHAFKGKVIATSHRAGASIFDTDLSGEIALVFGNEGAGLSRALTDAAHAVVAIPMRGKVESLNIAAAAAICLFERVRQRAGR